MKTFFQNKRISGILGILPEKLFYYDDEMRDSQTRRNQMIKKNMGYHQRYRAKKETTVSQLCIRGLEYLFDHKIIQKEDVGAVVVSTFTPDYYVPQVSNLIHAAFDLPEDVFVMDIWGGCSGYLKGLFQAFSLLDIMEDKTKKVLLFTGDVFNRQNYVGLYDMPPYGGDGASVTVIEHHLCGGKIPFWFETDGTASELISFTQGAFYDLFHKKKCKFMGNSNEAFLYFQRHIPELIQDILQCSETTINEIEEFFFIQASKMSVRKFADKLSLPYEKVIMDIVERYGDLSATVNPVSIADWYTRENISHGQHKVLICGYGAGAEWGAVILELGELCICENIKTAL